MTPAPKEQKQPVVEVTIMPKAVNAPRIKPVLQTIPADMFMPAANRQTIESPADVSEEQGTIRNAETTRLSSFPPKTRR
jgi:hypothetical protein